MKEIINSPSPNYTPKKNRREVSVIVIHATAGKMPGCLLWMMNKDSRVSAHYLIDRFGQVYNLVDENDVAWHAGKSTWNKKPHVNLRSIGIELENDNKGQKYSPEQYDSLVELTSSLVLKYNIAMNDVVRHADISPGRKTDPWKFPWKKFINDLAKHVIYNGIREISWQTTVPVKKSCWQKLKEKIWRRRS